MITTINVQGLEDEHNKVNGDKSFTLQKDDPSKVSITSVDEKHVILCINYTYVKVPAKSLIDVIIVAMNNPGPNPIISKLPKKEKTKKAD